MSFDGFFGQPLGMRRNLKTNTMDMIGELRAYLANKPPGRLTPDEISQVEGLLSACWADLVGSSEGGMAGSKLLRRSEGMEWRPPLLALSIERHGALVQGSTRAELQHWNIDTANATAQLIAAGRRQLRQMDATLDVKALANEVAALVLEGHEDPRVQRLHEAQVQIEPARIIPQTNKQTTASRRRRFADELTRLLALRGWRLKSRSRFLIFVSDAIS